MSELPEREHQELRLLLAAVPLTEPPPESVRRWHAGLAALPTPTATPPAAGRTTTRAFGYPSDPISPVPATGPTPVSTSERVPGVGAEPPPPAPVHPAARKGVAPETPASSVGPAQGPVPSRPGPVLGAGVLAAAAAACALLWLPGAAAPAPPPPDGPSALNLGGAHPPAAEGSVRLLTDPSRQAECLRTVGVPGTTVLGGQPVLVNGKAGMLLVLPTRNPGRFRALVVTPDCGRDAGRILSDTVQGR